YYDGANGDLRLGTRQLPGQWDTSPVDVAGDVGGYTSLVGGPSHGGYGIAYYDFTNADLKYAVSAAGGSWSIETVDGAGAASVGRFCSAVAFSGSPYDDIGIGYYDRTHRDLKYALKRGGPWVTTPEDTAGDTGGSVA